MSHGHVITQLLGGLGNQMFQYAVGRRIASDHGLELLIDDSVLNDHSQGRHVVNRCNDLDVFTLKVRAASPAQRRWFNPHGLPILDKLLFRLGRFLPVGTYYLEKSFRFDEALVSGKTPPAYLAGLWQSYRYFDGIEADLRSDFTFRHPLMPESLGLAQAMARPNAVCLNVRRGDYIHHSDTAATIGFVGLDYYRNAVELLKSRIGSEPAYYVFSDDLDWCKSELGWLGNDITFVEHQFAGEKFGNYLRLMSGARNFIIPNSTFAWWAAWLSSSADKCVIAPRQWFRDASIDSTDLCPPDWIQL